jgi:predicted aspartyl protease
MCDRTILVFRGALLTAIAVSTAWGDPSTVSRSGKSSPEETLQGQGLKKVGAAYVLQAEEDLKAKQVALRLGYQEWEHLRARIDQLRDDANKQRGLLANLESQRRALLASIAASQSKANSKQSQKPPPPPPDGFRPPPPPDGFGPPPPPDGFRLPPVFDHHEPGRSARERENRIQQVQRLERQIIQARSQIILAKVLERRLSIQARKKQGEIRRRENALGRLVDAVSNRYVELAADSAVVQALAEINADAPPRAKLGPVEDYKANLAKMAGEYQGSKGEPGQDKEQDRGADLVLGTDTDVRMLAPLIETFQVQLGNALGKQQARRHDASFREKRLGILLATEKRLESSQAGDAAGQKEQVAAQLKSTKDLIKRSRDEAEKDERASEELAVQINVLREAFLTCVAALRGATEWGQHGQEAPAVEDKTKGAAADSKGNNTAQNSSRLSAQQRAFLDEVEKKIHAETIALEPDKTVLWVDTILNGKSDQRMVLDPDVATIRVSARFAAALGISRDENRPAVAVAMSDRTSLSANPARIASLQVGPFTLNDVECLILPDGYDTPPLLGASFLDHFASRVDLPAARLTLVKVDVKPTHNRAAP